MARLAPFARKGFWLATHAIVVAAIATMLIGLAARKSWVFELATHFRLQCFLVLALATFLYACGRRFRLAALAGVIAGGIAWTFLPFYVSPDDAWPTSLSRSLRFVSMNVMRFNADHQRVLNYVRKVKPDVLLAIEVSPRWAKALEPLRDEFVSAHYFPRDGSLGMAVFSQLPLDDVKTELTAWGVPLVVARLQFEGRPLTVFGAHPPSPVDASLAQARLQSLEETAVLIQNVAGRVVLMGDLNMTSWSPYFVDLLASTGLRDTRLGFGIQPSWAPRSLGLLPMPMRIPIDHCLVSKGMFIHDRRLGDDIGSDHFPIEIDLSLAED
ncbi:MAG TPA: endonuclease/exonuclease/phosphatase family protein [Pirellulales bacterium]|nr:endonuclease/exonuclease/phosphatase family protein [Pirellulales bacterium]